MRTNRTIAHFYYSLYINISTAPRDAEGRVRPTIRGNRRRGTILIAWMAHWLTGAGVTVVEERFDRGEKGKTTKTVFSRRAL